MSNYIDAKEIEKGTKCHSLGYDKYCKCYGVLPFQKKINIFLAYIFGALGSLIARHWASFIIFPFIIGCIAITGLRRVEINDDFESFSLPVNGRWSMERDYVEGLFGRKMAQFFDPPRLSSLGQYVNIIIKTKEGKSIIREEIWGKINTIDEILRNMSIEYQGKSYTYQDICAHGLLPCFSPVFPIRPDELSQLGFLLSKIPVDFGLVTRKALNTLLPAATHRIIDYNHSVSANPTTPFQTLLSEISQKLIFSSLVGLKYAHFVNFTLINSLGKSKFDENGILISSEAISLIYWLKSESGEMKEIVQKWQRVVQNIVTDVEDSEIDISFYSSRTPNDEMEIANEKMKPLVGLSGLLMIIFASASATLKDGVRNKIILSLLGIFSVVLATGSAFGILTYCKIPFIGINLAVIFLMLGIGIDDMFVILAAWRMTPIHDSVEQRMKVAYEHAGVSVTITSLTNVVAFSIGAYTDIKSIRIFSIYSSFAVLTTYIFFITFFGGALAAFGYLEKSQRHSIFCVKVDAKSQSSQRSRLYQYFMAGGINSKDPHNLEDNEPHFGMVLVRDVLGSFLNNAKCKAGICITYLIYLIIALYGVVNLKQEKHPDLVSFQKITTNFFKDLDEFFNEQPSFVQVVFTKELDFSNIETRQRLIKLHDHLEALPFVQADYTVSWIRDWYETIDKNPSLISSYDDEQKFVKELVEFKGIGNNDFKDCSDMFEILKSFTVEELLTDKGEAKISSMFQNFPCSGKEFVDYFMTEKFVEENSDLVQAFDIIFWVIRFVNRASSMYEMDVNFDQQFERIESSRILIVVKNASSDNVQRSLRETVEKSEIPGVQVFSYLGNIVELIDLVKWTTIISVVSTVLIVLCISFIFIPNMACSLWVAFSIVSIELGIIGFMVLSQVKLNSVSMVNLIMCLGFSVDFSAHITYAYMNSKGNSAKDWTREALYSVGLPIILGGFSTIVALIPGWFMNDAIFTTFYKIIFLAILFGMVHGLIFLPTFMALIGPKNFGHYHFNRKLSDSQNLSQNFIFTDQSEIKIIKISNEFQQRPYPVQVIDLNKPDSDKDSSDLVEQGRDNPLQNRQLDPGKLLTMYPINLKVNKLKDSSSSKASSVCDTTPSVNTESTMTLFDDQESESGHPSVNIANLEESKC